VELVSPPGVIINTGADVIPNLGDGDVSAEWAFLDGLSGVAPGGAEQGISAVGFSSIGFPDVDGPPGSITSVDDTFSTYGGRQPTEVVQNSVIFTLGGLPSGYTVTDTYHVSVVFGSSLGEPIPEPGSLLLLGSGLLGLGFLRRRAHSAKRASGLRAE